MPLQSDKDNENQASDVKQEATQQLRKISQHVSGN